MTNLSYNLNKAQKNSQLNNQSYYNFKDVIYGDIKIPDYINNLMQTKEFKRLKNIRQLGFCYIDNDNLSNYSRFIHSVGASYLSGQMINQINSFLIKNNKETIPERKSEMIQTAILLHDIGHGPFSHSSEEVFQYSHELRTRDILTGETEVNEELKSKWSKEEIKQIIYIITKLPELKEYSDKYTPMLKSVACGQVAADRMDWFFRDAYFANMKTDVDKNKIIKAFEVFQNENKEYELSLNKSAVPEIEKMLTERYQRFKEFYYSDTSNLSNKIWLNFIKRFKSNAINILSDNYTSELSDTFIKATISPEQITLDEFLSINDNTFIDSFNKISKHSEDKVLKELSKPFNKEKFINIETNDEEIVKSLIGELFNTNLSETYSLFKSEYSTPLYKKKDEIKINDNGKIKNFSEITKIDINKRLNINYISFNKDILNEEINEKSEKEFIKNENMNINKYINIYEFSKQKE